MVKSLFKYIILIIAVPLIIISGAVIFKDKQYAWVTLMIALLACVPFMLTFERKSTKTEEIVILAVMVALAVVGRVMFTLLPHFKPVTAIVVIAGMYLGAESGFLCGALSALVSNLIQGQGPWTPFQMFAWGMVGLFAALLARVLKKNMIILMIYAVFSGIFYSLILDVWTTLSVDGNFNISRYIAFIITAIPTTVIYSISNAIFLFVLSKPIGKKLRRIKGKYGI